MENPNPEADERNMKNKDNTKLARTKNPGDWCVLWKAFLTEKNSSTRQLLMSNFFPETRLFWG